MKMGPSKRWPTFFRVPSTENGVDRRVESPLGETNLSWPVRQIDLHDYLTQKTHQEATSI